VIRRLNHAVLYVRDANASAVFYVEALGLQIRHSMGHQAVFLASPRSGNDHDLGLFSVGDSASPSTAGRGSVGLYHLAWEVDTLGELAEARTRLDALRALGGASNHGASRSLYAKDPDGIEFEVLWEVPAELLNPEVDTFGVQPLDLDADIRRFGRDTTRHQRVAPAGRACDATGDLNERGSDV
jgi:catechol-2,3-dioxygenase